MLAIQRAAQVIRDRLRNPPNAVPDDGIDLKRKKTIKLVQLQSVQQVQEQIVPISPDVSRAGEIAEIETAIERLRSKLDELREEISDVPAQPPAPLRPRIETIQRYVCERTGISMHDIVSDHRTAAIVHARHIAVYLCRKLTIRSLPEIGRRFNKDHTSIMHAIRRIEAKRQIDQELNSLLEKFTAELSQ